MKKVISFFIVLFLSLGTFAFENGDDNDKKKKKINARPDLPGTFLVDLGFNFLMDNPDNMDMGFWGSKVINFYYYWHIPIGKSNFSIGPGIGVGLEKYSFDNNNTLALDNDGETVIVEIANILEDSDIKKSKIAANYIDIPLEFRFHLNKEDHSRGFRAAIGGKVGFLFDGHTKIKYEQDGDNKKLKQKENYNLQRLRYGVSARIGFPGINLFGYYSLSELFENDKGPEDTATTSLNLGISFSLF
ncbi:outer membrane beta-barrel protein [Fulvivirgaceae bacterium BMA12]|uniref:Outer membrane beta-barrel protein n=1 Tax=Agaribacillus aureus TaxID=3051825 RepID=A0ABT8LCJ5_9BACT|nr:outer membrane beta-barrel protein [Fulvivirgaceae bacterium BMA12]